MKKNSKNKQLGFAENDVYAARCAECVLLRTKCDGSIMLLKNHAKIFSDVSAKRRLARKKILSDISPKLRLEPLPVLEDFAKFLARRWSAVAIQHAFFSSDISPKHCLIEHRLIS